MDNSNKMSAEVVEKLVAADAATAYLEVSNSPYVEAQRPVVTPTHRLRAVIAAFTELLEIKQASELTEHELSVCYNPLGSGSNTTDILRNTNVDTSALNDMLMQMLIARAKVLQGSLATHGVEIDVMDLLDLPEFVDVKSS